MEKDHTMRKVKKKSAISSRQSSSKYEKYMENKTKSGVAFNKSNTRKTAKMSRAGLKIKLEMWRALMAI
jgi:hypothetical protein